MSRTSDSLWRAAQQRSWSHRPQRLDVDAIAAAIASADGIVGAYRLVPGVITSCAVAITSRALVIGGANPGRHVKEMVTAAPSAYRYSPKVLAIPRDQIVNVEITSHGITVHTDAGRVELAAPAGPNRHQDLEDALLRLGRRGAKRPPSLPAPSGATTTTAPEPQYPGLWSSRSCVGGQIVITSEATADVAWVSEFLMSAGRAWRRLRRWAQWLVAAAIFVALQTVAVPAGVVFVVLLVVFLAGTDAVKSAERRAAAAEAARRPRPGTPETELSASGSIEARVAGAACRAWDETVREPSWHSAALAATTSSFDGRREVDTIVDLALRIHAARQDLGARPTSAAADYWQLQVDALDRAALQLGERADALIRHRDQAAELSAELDQLAELERLERSALVVDGITLAAAAPGAGQGSVSDQITAARAAVGELVDLMTRTRAPLAEPHRTPTL